MNGFIIALAALFIIVFVLGALEMRGNLKVGRLPLNKDTVVAGIYYVEDEPKRSFSCGCVHGWSDHEIDCGRLTCSSCDLGSRSIAMLDGMKMNCTGEAYISS